jgi:phage head maturation protease
VTRSGDGLLRTVTSAELFEISLVTRAAYDQAQIAARNWQPFPPASRGLYLPLARWR